MAFLKFLASKMFLRNFFLAVIIIPLFIWILFFFFKIYTHHGQALPVPDYSNKTIQEVSDICEESNLRYEIIDSIFLENKKHGTIVDQNPKPGTMVKQNRTIFLTVNAFNQLKVKMPNVIGGSVRQAKARFEALGFKIGKLIYVQDFARNNILKQQINGKKIEKDVLVEKGSYIDLVVGNGMSNTKTGIPKLIGLSLNEAREVISDAFLNYGKSFYDETVKTYQDSLNAKVWNQYPVYIDGNTLRLGHRVNVYMTVVENKIIIINEK